MGLIQKLAHVTSCLNMKGVSPVLNTLVTCDMFILGRVPLITGGFVCEGVGLNYGSYPDSAASYNLAQLLLSFSATASGLFQTLLYFSMRRD